MQKPIAAQNQARAAFEKSSKMYSRYQRVPDALLTAKQRLAATFTKIDEEAKKFKWAAEAAKMLTFFRCRLQ